MSQTKGKVSKALLVFLFQPFLGFLASLRNLDSRAGKFIFVAFATLWGYSQSFSYPPADVYRLGAAFCQYGIYEFFTIVDLFREGNILDVYLLIINYCVHLFSENAKVFFALLGLIYGVVCYATLSSLIKERRNGRSNTLSHILFLLFATASLANLSMPRYWTAAWLAALIFLKTTQGKKKWGWMALLLPFIHFSFVPVAVALIIIALFNKSGNKFNNVLFICVTIMFVLSFLLNQSNVARLIPREFIEDNSKMASKLGYVSNETLGIEIIKDTSTYREVNNIVTSVFQFLMKIGSFIMLLFFRLHLKNNEKDNIIPITYFGVLVAAFVVYFMSIIPTVGWRYINVLWLMLFIMLYRYYDIIGMVYPKRMLLVLYGMNIYTIAFMFYVTYRTVDLLLFYAPLPFVIIHGIGFPPVVFV